jgi:nitroreductase
MDLLSKGLADADIGRQVASGCEDTLENKQTEGKVDSHADPTPLNLKAPRDIATELDEVRKREEGDIHPELDQAFRQTERALQRMLSAAIAFCDGCISAGQLRAVRELLREKSASNN